MSAALWFTGERGGDAAALTFTAIRELFVVAGLETNDGAGSQGGVRRLSGGSQGGDRGSPLDVGQGRSCPSGDKQKGARSSRLSRKSISRLHRWEGEGQQRLISIEETQPRTSVFSSLLYIKDIINSSLLRLIHLLFFSNRFNNHTPL